MLPLRSGSRGIGANTASAAMLERAVLRGLAQGTAFTDTLTHSNMLSALHLDLTVPHLDTVRPAVPSLARIYFRRWRWLTALAWLWGTAWHWWPAREPCTRCRRWAGREERCVDAPGDGRRASLEPTAVCGEESLRRTTVGRTPTSSPTFAHLLPFTLCRTPSHPPVVQVGIMAPERHPTGRLLTGQVGYVICGIKDLKAARVGDTLYAVQSPGAAGGGGAATAGVVPEPPPPLPGFRPAKSMVFAGLFPLGGGEGTEFDSLAAAMDKLLLNDSRCALFAALRWLIFMLVGQHTQHPNPALVSS